MLPKIMGYVHISAPNKNADRKTNVIANILAIPYTNHT
jgi:hypothetical protein